MKLAFFIVVVFSYLFLHAQKEKPCFVYINGKLFKTTCTENDSLFYKHVVKKNKHPFLLLDSVIRTEYSVSVYLTSLKEKVNLILTDTNQQIVFKKTYKLKKIGMLFSDIIQQYANKGYPFTQIKLKDIRSDSLRITFMYQIIPLEKFYYDSLDIIGKPLVSKAFLQAYLGIKPGKVYKEKEISAIEKNLDMLPFYKRTERPKIFYINNKAKPRIMVEKNNANQLSGVAVLSTSQDYKFILHGDIQVNVNNILKHADMWKIQWKKTDTYSQNLFLEGSYPYLFLYPIGLSGSLSMIKQDTSFVSVNYKTGIDFYTRAFNGVSIFFEKKQTHLISAQPLLAPISTSLAGISVKHSYVNQILLPTKGYGITISLAYGQRKLTSREGLSEQLIRSIETQNKQLVGSGQFFALLPLTRWLMTKVSINSGYLNTAQAKNELFRCGGSRSIRGFDEESLWAQSYAIATIEPTAILDKNTHLFVFYDKMFYRSLNHIYDEPWSFGFGAEINTTGGLFFISYALGSQFNQPIQFKTAKLHFGYKNRF